MSIPVVTILKLDSKLTNLGLWEDIWDPLNDKGRWLLLIWGSVTNFEEGFQLQRSQHRLLLYAAVAFRYVLYFHFGAFKQLVSSIPVLDKATCDFQGHLWGV